MKVCLKMVECNFYIGHLAFYILHSLPGSFSNFDRSAHWRKSVNFLDIFIFHGNAPHRPVFVVIDYEIFMGPGTMYANGAADTRGTRNFPILFSAFESVPAFFCRVIKRHETVPFIVRFFINDPEAALGRIFIAFHSFIIQAVVPKYYRVGGVPALAVIYAKRII